MDGYEDDFYIQDDVEYTNESLAAELADEIALLDNKNDANDQWNKVGTFLMKMKQETRARSSHWWCRHRYPELSRFMLRLAIQKKENKALQAWVKESHRQLGLCTDCMEGYHDGLSALAEELLEEGGQEMAKKSMQELTNADMDRFKVIWSHSVQSKEDRKVELNMALYELFSNPRMMLDNRYIKPLYKWISNSNDEVNMIDFTALNHLPGLFMLSTCQDSALRSWSARILSKGGVKLTTAITRYMEELMYILENESYGVSWISIEVSSTKNFSLFANSIQSTISPTPQILWAGLDTLFQALEPSSAEKLLRRFSNLPDLVFSCLQDVAPGRLDKLIVQALLVVTRCYKALLSSLKSQFWEHASYDETTVLEMIIRQCQEGKWQEFITIGFLEILPSFLLSLRPLPDQENIDKKEILYFSVRKSVYSFLLKAHITYSNHTMLTSTASRILYSIIREAYDFRPTKGKSTTMVKEGELPEDQNIEIVTMEQCFWWPYATAAFDNERNSTCFSSEWMEHLIETLKVTQMLQLVDAAAATIALVLQKHIYLIRDTLMRQQDAHGMLSTTWLIENLCAWDDVEKIPLTVHAALFECVGIIAQLGHIIPNSDHIKAFQECLAPYVARMTFETTAKGLLNVFKVPIVAQHITLCLISTHPDIRGNIKRLIIHGSGEDCTKPSTTPLNVPYQMLVNLNIPSFCRGVIAVLMQMRSQGYQNAVLKELLLHWTYIFEGLPDRIYNMIIAYDGKSKANIPLSRLPRLLHDYICSALQQFNTLEESYGVRVLRFAKQFWRFWWMFQPKQHKCTQYPGNRLLISLLKHGFQNPSATLQRRIVDLATFIVGELSHAKGYSSFRLDGTMEQELSKICDEWRDPDPSAPIDVENPWNLAEALSSLKLSITNMTAKMKARKSKAENDRIKTETWIQSVGQKSNQANLLGWIQSKSLNKQSKDRARLEGSESMLNKVSKHQQAVSKLKGGKMHMTTKMTSDTVVNAPSRQNKFYDDVDIDKIVRERALLAARKAVKTAEETKIDTEDNGKDASESTGNSSYINIRSDMKGPNPSPKAPIAKEVREDEHKLLSMVRHIRGMRKPIAPCSLLPFFRQILLASSSLGESENSLLERPPIDFESAGHYTNLFAPLLLEETKSDLIESWSKLNSLHSVNIRFQSEQARENLRLLVFTITTTVKGPPPFRNYDVIHISGHDSENCVGIYLQQEKKDKTQKKEDRQVNELQILMAGSEDLNQDMMLNQMDILVAKTLGNLTTSAREYVALMALDLIPIHLRNVVLNPSSCKSNQSILLTMVNDFEKYKSNPNSESTGELKKCLKKLYKMNIQLEDLRVTNIGVAVKKLKKYKEDENIPAMASALIQKWAKLLTAKDALDETPAFVPDALWDALRPMYNQSQLQSIHSVLSNYETGVSLLQGPPGTGKTKTVLGLVSGLLAVQLPPAIRSATVKPAMINFNAQDDGLKRTSIQQIKNQSLSRQRLNGVIDGNRSRIGVIQKVMMTTQKGTLRVEKKQANHILICAPSNGAVDELISRLLTDGVMGPDGTSIRVTPPTLHRSNSILSAGNEQQEPHVSIIRLGSVAENGPEAVKQVCLKGVVRRNIETHPKYQASRALYDRERQLRDHIRAFHAEVDPEKKKKDKKEMTKWHRELSEVQGKNRRLHEEIQGLEIHITTSLLTQANIIACTLSKCGSGDLNCIPRGFDAVIIDEAAQAVEISTLIPLRERVARVIFVGDPKQLPATVKSVRAQDFLYNRSLFERLAEGGFPRAILRVQYRMHPFLRDFPSKCFYGGILNDGPVIATRLLSLGDQVYKHVHFQPFLLFNIDGRESNGSGGSKYNLEEANFGINIVQEMHEKLSLVKSKQWSIGFVTPYKEQVNTLKKLVREHGYDDVEVNTVDGFQGREKDVIIFSCVRTKGIGFLRDLRRLNVAMTRARYCCFVLGHVNTLRENSTWKQLVDSAMERKLLIHVGQKKYNEIKNEMKKNEKLKIYYENMHKQLINKFKIENNEIKEIKRKRSISFESNERSIKETKIF